MRFVALIVGAASLGTSARAQVDGVPFDDINLECEIFDDGTGADAWWKIANPSGASDWFNVDFDATFEGRPVLGICMDIWDTIGSGDTMTIGIYPESGAFPNTPDIANPILELHARMIPDDSFGDLVTYALPTLHLGSMDIHVGFQSRQGDSAT